MGYYDMTEGELKLAEIGREIAEYAENNKTKSLEQSGGLNLSMFLQRKRRL